MVFVPHIRSLALRQLEDKENINNNNNNKLYYRHIFLQGCTLIEPGAWLPEITRELKQAGGQAARSTDVLIQI